MNRETKVLLIASNIWFFAEGMLGPLFAVFAQRIGGDILEISWAWATFLIIHGLLSIIIGKVFDSESRMAAKEKLLIAGYVLNAVFTFGYLFVSGPTSLFIVEAGLGVAAALATPTWDALFAYYARKQGAGLVWGLEDGLAKIMTGVAIVVGALLVSISSFSVLFFVMGCLQVVATVVQMRIFRRHPRS